MKTFTLLTAFLAGNVAAFPKNMDMLTGPLAAEALKLKRQISSTAPQGAGALPLTPPPFDAKSQYVSNTGAHKVRMEQAEESLNDRLQNCSSSLLVQAMLVESVQG